MKYFPLFEYDDLTLSFKDFQSHFVKVTESIEFTHLGWKQLSREDRKRLHLTFKEKYGVKWSDWWIRTVATRDIRIAHLEELHLNQMMDVSPKASVPLHDHEVARLSF
jgi:hypothetical protein